MLADVESVARHAAEVIAGEARAAVKARGRFTVAISGGRTPWVMLRALSSLDVPWENVHVLQVDERIAPAGHADRNLTHLRASLLAPGSTRSGADPCDAGGIARPRRGGRALRADPRRRRRIAAGPRSRPSRPGRRRTHRVAGSGRSGARRHRRRRRADRACTRDGGG